MTLDARVRLRYAVAATRFGRGPVAVATAVRRAGLSALDAILDGLGGAERDDVETTVEELRADGVQALLLGTSDYPAGLAATRSAPAALFVRGARELLDRPALGICGSRRAAADGLRAARSCGEVLTAAGLGVVSGHARGVDVAAHHAALAAGGTTVAVLPEGISGFRPRPELVPVWDDTRAVVVSQFSPRQPWSAGGAMARNAVIAGLSRALVVIEAGETGGTLAAGLHALDRGQTVLLLETPGSPAPGNRLLAAKGASTVHTREEFEARLRHLPRNRVSQLSLL